MNNSIPTETSRTIKALMLASGKTLTGFVYLIAFAVLSRVLTLQDYATYRQTMLAYDFIVPLLMLGLPMALYYFLPKEKKRVRAVLIENLTLLSLSGAAFSLFLLLGGNKLLAMHFNNPDLERTLHILAPYPLLMLPASALSACLITLNKVKTVAIFNPISRSFMLVLVITAGIIWRNPDIIIEFTVIGAAIILIPALILMFSSAKGSKWHPNTLSMWKQLKYSVPLGISGILGSISISLDKFIVSSMCSLKAFAIFVNGAIEIPLIRVITGSVTAILLPEFVYLYQRKEYKQILSLWHRAIVKVAVLIFPIMIFLFCMGTEVMRVLYSSKYEASSIPFRIYLLMLPLRITSFGAIIMASGRSRHVLYGSAIALVFNLILNIIFVSKIGATGAAIATVLSNYITLLVYMLVVIKKILGISYFHILPLAKLFRIFFLSLPSVIVFGLNFIFPTKDALNLAVTGILYMSGTYFLFIKNNIIDRLYIKSKIDFVLNYVKKR